jgi:hypothetical protein
VREV